MKSRIIEIQRYNGIYTKIKKAKIYTEVFIKIYDNFNKLPSPMILKQEFATRCWQRPVTWKYIIIDNLYKYIIV